MSAPPSPTSSPTPSTSASSTTSSPLLPPAHDPASSSSAPSTPSGSSHDDSLPNPLESMQLPPAAQEDAGLRTLRAGMSTLDLQEAHQQAKSDAAAQAEPSSDHTPQEGSSSAAEAASSMHTGSTADKSPIDAPPATLVTPSSGPLDTSSPSPSPVPSTSAASSFPSPSSSAAPAPPPGAADRSSAAAAPPPLFPRASAPPSVPQGPLTGGARKTPVPGAGGALKAGVRGMGGMSGQPLKMPPSLAAKMAAMTSRNSSGTGSPSSSTPIPSLKPSSSSSGAPALAPRPPPRPAAGSPVSAPAGRLGAGALAGPGGRPAGGMAARRRGLGAGLTLSAMGLSMDGNEKEKGKGPSMRLDGLDGGAAVGGERVGSPNQGRGGTDEMGTPFSNFRKIVDPSGRLNFAQKAILHADGVDFSSGASFKIKMDDFELFEELGKGNYGTVQKVLHRPTAVTMALKEIRLELDDSKLKTIITELDILHRATSPYIIDFYGAFFIESCVYYCMEYMDAGSLEFVAGIDVPEDVLARVTRSMVEGLKFLKDELKIMHRDVKPTNVLLNRKGFVKLCDFGVSGQLDRSLAKTNIGCQSYMAPERIKGESQGAPSSYTASSDVWSLGLSIIEAAIGHYPYPPETYQNVFAQLTAIVHGDPPSLPERYSDTAQEFVGNCLIKQAARRPTYAQLLEHPWLKQDVGRDVDMVGWIAHALAYREKNPKVNAPALA
ncbi:hypothetical protein JCM1840_000878 [Sporobolomyces johnsonii]